MKRYCIAVAIALASSLATVQAQEEKDIEGGQDHPLFSRMPGYFLSSYDTKDFDSFQSAYLSGDDARWEGKLTKLGYSRKSGSKPVSMTQIARNYEEASKKIGGKILYKDARILDAKIQKNGAVTFVEVAAFNDGRDYELLIVESKPMEQEVTANAEALSQSIAATGKAAVYGIYFDTGKSIVKPESNPTLEEITKLLRQSTQLKLYVVGHTDNVGTLDANLKLSSDRAAAVVKALVSRGIDAARLKAAGVGPYSPETANTTEEGRAKNRRVELVGQN
jgi:outer membrane protein OmpA-like peptidoglycan-associated protein